MSKKIKILTPRIYEHSDFFHNAYDFARENSLNTNELCLELSHYLVEHFDKVWKIEKPRIYKQITDLQSQLAEKEKEIECQENMKILAVKNQNQKAIELLEKVKTRIQEDFDYDALMYWLNSQIKKLKEGK